ncbi:hypothetical protein CHS0354_029973 [Potamilus streckersoni]|uniref:Uncharacterized protein n=1 Tax=Potamilus streckersoni TaxID=2493646 RepID=A0AAE0WEJ7_9BIVA|nr:hypothetical protein CHS0354_029973 [Potamilus streckersoni]
MDLTSSALLSPIAFLRSRCCPPNTVALVLVTTAVVSAGLSASVTVDMEIVDVVEQLFFLLTLQSSVCLILKSSTNGNY